jgi:hypothetical protein
MPQSLGFSQKSVLDYSEDMSGKLLQMLITSHQSAAHHILTKLHSIVSIRSCICQDYFMKFFIQLQNLLLPTKNVYIYIYIYIYIYKLKVKQSRYRPGAAQRVPGS